MLVIDYIKEHGIEALSEFGIIVRDYPDRVTLNYNQIESPKRHPIVRECRGLVLWKPLSPLGDWKVLARSFDRFYNLGECPEREQKEERALLHHPNTIILEKVDGSLISVYHEAGHRWSCATRSMALAEGMTAQNHTFAEVFERALGMSVSEKMKGMNENYTYVFEMVSPETRVVTPYPADKVYLLSVRERTEPYTELSWDKVKEIAAFLNVNTPKEFKFNTLDEILKSLDSLPQMEEGYVARLDFPDRVFRVKIKNPRYLAISHMRSNGTLSLKKVVYLVLKNEEAEYLAYFPEDALAFEPYVKAREKMLEIVQELKTKYINIENQKEFALHVKDTPVAPIMFAIRKGKTISEVIENMSEDAQLNLLEKVQKYVG